MNDKRIYVIGSYIVALVMDTDHIPLKGETLMGRNFHTTHGGKGSNQAVQAARLGAGVSFVGKVGNDSFGEDFLSLCKAENIGCDQVSFHNTLPTASGFIICSSDGNNIITIDIGALNGLSEHDIDRGIESMRPDDIVLIQLEIPLKIAYYAALRSKAKGAKVIFNPAPAFNLTNLDLSVIDYLTPNESEARVCLGLHANDSLDNKSIAEQLLGKGCKNVIITLGEKGSMFCNNHRSMFIPPFKLPKLIDSTGAGDAFNAALGVALAEDMEIEDALLFANAAGALSCTRLDTIPSFHNRHEIESFMKKYKITVEDITNDYLV